MRAFNHIGPGQDARFVLPNVARQIARAERDGLPEVEVRVGNVDTRRDFTDVRDMVRAYWLILERGDPDALYLACRGASTPVRELIEGLAAPRAHPRDLHLGRRRCGARASNPTSMVPPSGSGRTRAGRPRSRSTRRWPTRSPGGASG